MDPLGLVIMSTELYGSSRVEYKINCHGPPLLWSQGMCQQFHLIKYIIGACMYPLLLNFTSKPGTAPKCPSMTIKHRNGI